METLSGGGRGRRIPSCYDGNDGLAKAEVNYNSGVET
jgi:hypothetical protein